MAKKLSSIVMDDGYDAGFKGEPCVSPCSREPDIEIWTKGWKAGNKARQMIQSTAITRLPKRFERFDPPRPRPRTQ